MFNGSHQRYQKLDDANNTYAFLASYFRYKTRRSLSFGFLNTLSYTDLKLLDTEGDALPIDQFEAISDQIKLYALYSMNTNLRFGLGIFYQFFNIEEVNGQYSLDYEKNGFDLSSRYLIEENKTVRLIYKLEQFQYDERKSTSIVNGPDPANPALEIRRQEVALSYRQSFSSDPYLKIQGKYRINDDRFEDYLSYRQAEIEGQLENLDLRYFLLTLDLIYRKRRYPERRNIPSPDTIFKESFIIARIGFSKNVLKWLSVSLRYELTDKSSNAADNSYKNHLGLFSLDANW